MGLAVRNIPRSLALLTQWLGIHSLPTLLFNFLHEQHAQDLENFPNTGKVFLYPSAVATYYAPSDKSGIGGMFRERIRCVNSWRGGPPRRDCVFITHDEDLPGFQGLYVGQVLAWMKIKHENICYCAALITPFETVGDQPCPLTNMWKVHRLRDNTGRCILKIIHLDAIFRSTHLIGVPGTSSIPYEVNHTNALDAYRTFYVNKFIDYHAHEIAF